MSDSNDSLLKRYQKLPDRLEAAIAGLDEAQLDLSMGTGWSIREYVHHTVEGEQMWQIFLKAIIGRDGIEIPIQWYLALSQDDWAKRWAWGKRAVGPSLSLYRGSTASLVELLRNIPHEGWEHYGWVTWPEDVKETQVTVRDIVLMHLGHVDHHAGDIHAIRTKHGV